MEDQKTIIRIDDLGRIVLPIEARNAMGWGEKTPVEILVKSADKEIVLRSQAFACAYCGASENLKSFQKKHICPACQAEIAKL